MAVRYILFDIDDTLFPSSEFAELARKKAVAAMASAGIGANVDELYSMLLKIIEKKGSNYDGHFNDLCKELKIKRPARYIAAAVAAYHNAKSTIAPYPEVKLLLGKLKEAGYKLYVVTNGNSIKQWDKLIRLGIDVYFEDVFVSEELGKTKSREFFTTVLRKLGVGPSECVVIGDREDADIETAKKVGIKTIRVKRGRYARVKSNANIIVKDLVNIAEAIKNL